MNHKQVILGLLVHNMHTQHIIRNISYMYANIIHSLLNCDFFTINQKINNVSKRINKVFMCIHSTSLINMAIK